MITRRFRLDGVEHQAAAIGILNDEGLRVLRRCGHEAVAQACALEARMEGAGGAGRHADTLATVRDYSRAFAPGTGPLRRLQAVRRHGVRPRSAVRYPLFYYARVALWSNGRAADETEG